MAYIVTRNNRFYVVSYDGIDPTTGKERRRWQLAGTSPADAEAIAESLTEAPGLPIALGRDAATLADYYRTAWLPKRARCRKCLTLGGQIDWRALLPVRFGTDPIVRPSPGG